MLLVIKAVGLEDVGQALREKNRNLKYGGNLHTISEGQSSGGGDVSEWWRARQQEKVDHWPEGGVVSDQGQNYVLPQYQDYCCPFAQEDRHESKRPKQCGDLQGWMKTLERACQAPRELRRVCNWSSGALSSMEERYCYYDMDRTVRQVLECCESVYAWQGMLADRGLEYEQCAESVLKADAYWNKFLARYINREFSQGVSIVREETLGIAEVSLTYECEGDKYDARTTKAAPFLNLIARIEMSPNRNNYVKGLLSKHCEKMWMLWTSCLTQRESLIQSGDRIPGTYSFLFMKNQIKFYESRKPNEDGTRPWPRIQVFSEYKPDSVNSQSSASAEKIVKILVDIELEAEKKRKIWAEDEAARAKALRQPNLARPMHSPVHAMMQQQIMSSQVNSYSAMASTTVGLSRMFPNITPTMFYNGSQI